MSTLLVQSCSKSKNEADGPISAIELYSGYFFKIIKKSIREDTENANIDMCILSAKYGIVDPSEQIPAYDQRMDAERAREIGPEVRDELRRRITNNGYKNIVINVGKDYRRALSGFDNGLNVNTYMIEGDGIGTKGKALKQFLRGDQSALERAN
jgi:hypothetical protein